MLRRTRTKFESNPARNVISDAALYFAAKAAPGAIGLISVVVFVRLLGVEQFGLFSLLSSTAIMWSTFAVSWMSQGILRHCTNSEAFDRRLWRELCCGAAVATAFASLGVIANLYFIEPKPVWTIATLACLLAAISVLQTLAVTTWQAKLRPKRVLVSELFRTVTAFILCLILAKFVKPVPASLLIGTIVGYALGIQLPPRKKLLSSSVRFTSPRLVTLWHYGWPLSIWLGVQTAFPWFDRTSIAQILGLAATGTFASISDIVSRSFSLLVFPVTLAVHPRIMNLWNEARYHDAMRILRLAVIGCTAVCILLVLGFYLARAYLIDWLLPGIDRDTGIAAVPWLALAGSIWQIALLVHKPFELRNRTRVMLVCVLLSFGVKVTLNWLMIPIWGIVGAAGATFLSGFAYCVLCVVGSSEMRPEKA
jgi:O-antigen/teichoic acid export membrane protein